MNRADMNSAIFPILKTERLTLRQLSIDDQHDIFALRSDLKINEFLGRQLCETNEDAINFINKVNDNIDKGTLFIGQLLLQEPIHLLAQYVYSISLPKIIVVRLDMS